MTPSLERSSGTDLTRCTSKTSGTTSNIPTRRKKPNNSVIGHKPAAMRKSSFATSPIPVIWNSTIVGENTSKVLNPTSSSLPSSVLFSSVNSKKSDFGRFFCAKSLHISIIFSNFVAKITQRGPQWTLTECIQWGERRTFEYLLLKLVLVHVRK